MCVFTIIVYSIHFYKHSGRSLRSRMYMQFSHYFPIIQHHQGWFRSLKCIQYYLISSWKQVKDMADYQWTVPAKNNMLNPPKFSSMFYTILTFPSTQANFYNPRYPKRAQ